MNQSLMESRSIEGFRQCAADSNRELVRICNALAEYRAPLRSSLLSLLPFADMEIRNTPRALLVGSWGSEGLVSALTDALYRGASWEEVLSAQTQELVERRIGAFYRQGHWSVFEFMGAQFIVECSRACHTQFIRHRLASYWAESQRYVDYTKRRLRFIVPVGFPEEPLRRAYEDYVKLREGFRPEYARMVLPNASASTQSWRISSFSSSRKHNFNVSHIPLFNFFNQPMALHGRFNSMNCC